MFCRLLSLLTIAALLIGAPLAHGRKVGQSAIFANSFDESNDTNYDTWPDYWTRQTSPEYPHYTKIEIIDDPTADDGRSLKVDFDGGGAFLSTPDIPILPKFGYKIYVRAKASGLKRTEARMVIEFRNRQQERLQVEYSDPIISDGKWHDVQIDSVRPKTDDIDRAVIYLDAPRGRRGDLDAELFLDYVILDRLPSMVVKTGSQYNVYNDFKEVRVECTLSGIREQNPEIRFQLLDETSREIKDKTATKRLNGRLIVEDTFNADDIVGAIGNRPSGYEGTQYWTPNIEDYGFYKIRVEMLREEQGGEASSDNDVVDDYERQLEKKVITLAVLPKLPRPIHGEFGWTLPMADDPLNFDILSELLPRVGVHWVKLPVWYPVGDHNRGEEIIRFAERTSANDIEMVGILDSPLVDTLVKRDPNAPTDIADILLTDPSFWQPQFEHVMTRLSLRLRWWQLGNDWDTSFYGYSELPKKLLSIRKHLFRFGQDVRLGLGWRWPQEGKEEEWLPPHDDPIWEYEQMSSLPPLSADQLDKQMAEHPPGKPARWVLVDPTMYSSFDREEKDLNDDEKEVLHEDHVRQFVRQMVAAKIHGADGIFVGNPFTGPEGVMNTDGTPGELLLPWRTAASLLGGCHYLGELDLPSHSRNYVFQDANGKVLMIAWNDTPVTEHLYLGEQVEQIDVWGRRTTLELDDQDKVSVEIDRNPSFIIGLNPAVTQWRMAVEFDRLNIPSVFARPHANLIRGSNHFTQGVTGKYTIFVPERLDEGDDDDDDEELSVFGERRNKKWEILPRSGEFSIGSNEPYEVPINIVLDEATYGPQAVRIDFEIEADKIYKFSVWRTLHVGLGDITIDIATKIDERGQLIVEQRMTNNNGQTSDFKCLLYAKGRRRKRTQVVMLGPDGNTKLYQYPNGEQLLGNTLRLRAEEINGSRVLIYRFKAVEGGELPAEEPKPPARPSTVPATAPATLPATSPATVPATTATTGPSSS
ncbi:hypothetical protein [Aeoliella mucimassa]|nr:hypothetical protein [Aeoliella mucimassa]